MIKKPLCIYHGNCADGFSAAWVLWKKFGPENIEFHAGSYGEDIPDVAGREVFMVDFSYPPEKLKQILGLCDGLTILDHHKSAWEDFQKLRPTLPVYELSRLSHVTFDMNHSGAILSWLYFFPDQPAPQMLLHVEDRDLWKFVYTNTREVSSNLFSFPYDFDIWNSFMNLTQMEITGKFAQEGRAIERKHLKDIKELLTVCCRRMKIGDYWVLAANLPYTMGSEAGGILALTEVFGAYYWDSAKGFREFGLRSIKGGVDVSAIAKLYGGGGHENAAGFHLTFEEAKEKKLM